MSSFIFIDTVLTEACSYITSLEHFLIITLKRDNVETRVLEEGVVDRYRNIDSTLVPSMFPYVPFFLMYRL